MDAIWVQFSFLRANDLATISSIQEKNYQLIAQIESVRGGGLILPDFRLIDLSLMLLTALLGRGQAK